MKILATGMEWFERIPGGLNQYFADYLRSMIQRGHAAEGLLSGEGEKLQAPVYIRDVVSDSVKLDTYRRMKLFSGAVEERIKMFQPDLFNPHFALYSSLVTRNAIPRHIPIVTHFHGPWAHESQVEENGNPVKKYVRYQVKKKIEQAIYNRSDSFIVLSQYFQHVLSSDFGIPNDRIHVIPGAVDTNRFRPAEDRNELRNRMGLSGGTKVLFCARRLVRRMGIENLIKAMSSALSEVPGAKLFIAGEGPLREELTNLIEELGISASVRLLGRVSNEDLVRWYQAADLSIVPTVTLEGFGLVTTEALACGTPVLGTPNGGTKEILEKLSRELLFQDNSDAAMSRKLVSVLQGDSRIPSREQCRQYALEKYTWNKVSQAITQVFENAVEARKEYRKYESSLL